MRNRRPFILRWIRRRILRLYSRTFMDCFMLTQDEPYHFTKKKFCWDSRKSGKLLICMLTVLFTGILSLLIMSFFGSASVIEEDIFIDSPVNIQHHTLNPSLVNLSLAARAPFSSSNPTWVHILAYQRTGSTFTSGLLGWDPRVFYIFEPMEMLYTAMYGLMEEWTKVPNDIFNDQYGNQRIITEDEVSASEWLMEKMYNCNMSSLPTSILINQFWDRYSRNMPQVPKYWQCISDSGANLGMCQQHIRKYCSLKFSMTNGTQLQECKVLLWNQGKWRTDLDDIVWKYIDDGLAKKLRFTEYFKCVDEYAAAAEDCATIYMDIPCQSRKVRIIKTVRSTAELSARFFTKNDNFRLIHLLRDPRGVTLSRNKKNWAQGIFEKGNMTKIATIYCQNVLRDYVKTVMLRNRYVGKVMHVITDGVIRNLDHNAQAIFQFLNMSLLYETKVFIRNASQGLDSVPKGMTSSERINVWQYELSKPQVKEIVDVCKNLFRDLKFDWYYTKR